MSQFIYTMQGVSKTVPRRLLKKPVTNLSPQRDEILAALDLLFTGL